MKDNITDTLRFLCRDQSRIAMETVRCIGIERSGVCAAVAYLCDGLGRVLRQKSDAI
jgi:hypothetical protein